MHPFKIKLIIVSLYGLIVFSLYLLIPESLLYSKLPDVAYPDIFMFLLIFVVPLILTPFFGVKQFKWYLLGSLISSSLGYFSAKFIREQSINNELMQSHISALGIVTSKKYRKGHRGSGYWEFYCGFKFKQDSFRTFHYSDRENKINVGDTFEVQFLSRNPQISKVILSVNP